MQAVILAAGMGNRLGKMLGGKPKSLLEFGGQSLLKRQIHACQLVGIHDFVIVTGWQSEMIEQELAPLQHTDNIIFVNNPIYQSTNTLHSLHLAMPQITGDFIYFNADVLFGSRMLNFIMQDLNISQLLVDVRACGAEEVKVTVDENDYITAIGKEIDPRLCLGEFIGIGRFAAAALTDFAAALQLGVDEGHSNNYFEWAVDVLCKKHRLQVVPTAGVPCIEIDFPEDLEQARQKVWPLIKD